MSNVELAKLIVEKVGGKGNVQSVTHCMTRLRFVLNDDSKASQEELKGMDEVMGVVNKGGQYQLIIGPQVATLYDEVVKHVPGDGEVAEDFVVSNSQPREKITIKKLLNSVMGTLAGCMTPMIPILICAGLSKTIVAVFGPQLLGLLSEQSSIYILFGFVGDAGFYFLPVIVGYTAAKKFKTSELMGLFLGAILVHPTLVQMVADGTKFSVYGIPAALQTYSSTILPIILTVWVMSYVERFFKKYTPDVLKVLVVPFGTLLVMLPLMLTLFGPLGSFLGQYISGGIINLYNVAGPLAAAILGGTFVLIVTGGMHMLLFVFLFTTFPIMGYDAFLLPTMIACSWASAGVVIACIVKFRNKKNRALTIGYFLTWLLGGVGEPMIYGLLFPYRTPLYASIISGAIAGFISAIIGLKAYVLTPSNGIYGLAAFLGGPNSNYIFLGITIVASVVIGFVTMWFFKLDETVA